MAEEIDDADDDNRELRLSKEAELRLMREEKERSEELRDREETLPVDPLDAELRLEAEDAELWIEDDDREEALLTLEMSEEKEEIDDCELNEEEESLLREETLLSDDDDSDERDDEES